MEKKLKRLSVLFLFQAIKNDDLEELKELGFGTFGTVYHGKWRGTDVAIKRIKRSCFIGRSSEQERLVSFLSQGVGVSEDYISLFFEKVALV